MKKILKSKPEIMIGNNLRGEIFNYQSDTRCIQRLGYRLLRTINHRVRDVVNYYAKFFGEKRRSGTEFSGNVFG